MLQDEPPQMIVFYLVYSIGVNHIITMTGEEKATLSTQFGLPSLKLTFIAPKTGWLEYEYEFQGVRKISQLFE